MLTVIAVSLWVMWTAFFVGTLLNMVAIYYRPLRDIMYPHPDGWSIPPSVSSFVFGVLWALCTIILVNGG